MSKNYISVNNYLHTDDKDASISICFKGTQEIRQQLVELTKSMENVIDYQELGKIIKQCEFVWANALYNSSQDVLDANYITDTTIAVNDEDVSQSLNLGELHKKIVFDPNEVGGTLHIDSYGNTDMNNLTTEDHSDIIQIAGLGENLDNLLQLNVTNGPELFNDYPIDLHNDAANRDLAKILDYVNESELGGSHNGDQQFDQHLEQDLQSYVQVNFFKPSIDG